MLIPNRKTEREVRIDIKVGYAFEKLLSKIARASVRFAILLRLWRLRLEKGISKRPQPSILKCSVQKLGAENLIRSAMHR